METLQAHELLARLLLVLAAMILFKRMLPSPSKRRAAGPPPFPRPRGLPIVDNLHQLGALPQASLAALAARHTAPLMLLRLGSVPTLVVSSADTVRAAFQHNDRALSGRPALYAAARLSYGLRNISFAPPDDGNGGFWRAARRACLSELLGAPRVRAFRDVREAEAAALVAAVADESGDVSSPVNLSDRLVATTSRIVRRVAFGDDGDESIRTRAILEETQRLLGAFFVADYMPWLGWLDALRGLRRRLERNFHELDAFYEKVIDEHINKSSTESKKEEDLVDVLLRLHNDPAHRSTFGSRSQIKGILTDMFVAGTDTSSATVEWTMAELVRNQDVLAKAQQEVRSVVAAAANRGTVLESDLPRLRYLRLVIRESLRLHPPAPLLVPRETTEPCTVRGREVPAKTRVLVNAKAIGTDAGAWGADAARFVPERHEGDGGVDLGDHRPWHGGFSLLPFGLGRRSCPSVHFATAVVELLLANLLLAFDWRAPDGEAVDLEVENGLTVHKKNPLVLVAKRRCVDSGTHCRS